MKRKIIVLVIAVNIFLSSLLSFAKVKDADLAGQWYPSEASKLKDMLNLYMNTAKDGNIDSRILGLIVPHAGYPYSAPVAAYGYKALVGLGIKTVIVVGFNHRYYHEGLAVFGYDAFKTPLGELAVDKELTSELLKQSPLIYSRDEAFKNENSVEMQVPFIQLALGDVKAVLIAIGDQSLKNSEVLSDALYNTLKDKKDFVIIASTDMCHYLPYDKNNQVDTFTISEIKKFNPIELYTTSMKNDHRLMCGFGAVCAVMSACKKLGADEVVILKNANSGDVTFDRSQVVGYLSAAFVDTTKKQNQTVLSMKEESKEAGMLSKAQKGKMLELARNTIQMYLKDGKILDAKDDDPLLNKEMGAFVTLHERGQLRGCIGNIVGKGPFYKTVRDMSIESATGDPRFRPVTLDEMKDIDIEISALSPLEKITDPDKIIMGKHGVLVRQGFYSGVYLPQVATETGWTRDEFMDSLCGQKAGMNRNAWREGKCEIYIFEAEVFGEKTK